MAKRILSAALLLVLAALTISVASCSGGGESSSDKKKITYKCLSSSCDATVICNEGDPVPEHCGKRMIH
jgi:hypothetical protein